MESAGMMDMIFDALEAWAKNPRPQSPRPGRMELLGTLAAPQIFLEVVDPNPPVPGKAKEAWVISMTGIRKIPGSCLCAFGVTCPMHDEAVHG